MTKNCKEANKKCVNGYRKKINGSLYLVIGIEKRNEQWQERMDQMQIARTKAK